MASAELEPITGVWRLCPQRGPGAEPLVRGSGGLNAFLCCDMPDVYITSRTKKNYNVAAGRDAKYCDDKACLSVSLHA